MLVPRDDFRNLASLIKQIKDPIVSSQIYLSELAKTNLDSNQSELLNRTDDLISQLDRTFDIILSLSGLDQNHKIISNAIQTRLLLDQLVSDLRQIGQVDYRRTKALPGISGNYLKLYQSLLTIAKRALGNAPSNSIVIDSFKRSDSIIIRLIDSGARYPIAQRKVIGNLKYFRLDFELALALEIIKYTGGKTRLTRIDNTNYLNIHLPTQTQARLVDNE
ncbi:HAMP domain-containing histidine kinase [Candidatus Saccharibacteria bacterium]|nr:HAMP domain-containing histidine kinase [Candidatus Saccharibacteria bacterium]